MPIIKMVVFKPYRKMTPRVPGSQGREGGRAEFGSQFQRLKAVVSGSLVPPLR